MFIVEHIIPVSPQVASRFGFLLSLGTTLRTVPVKEVNLSSARGTGSLWVWSCATHSATRSLWEMDLRVILMVVLFAHFYVTAATDPIHLASVRRLIYTHLVYNSNYCIISFIQRTVPLHCYMQHAHGKQTVV